MTRMILLNPGPVTLSDNVRAALSREDCCHREPEFAALTRSINRRLLEIYPGAANQHAAVTLAGSGTSAVEAMLRSFTYRDGMALLIANGVYGERMAAIMDSAGRPYISLSSEWEEAINLDAVDRLLRDRPEINAVVAVHHETTTGRLNDLQGLGALCRQHDRPMLLDAVSSFGSEDIRFDDWNLLALASTANKCLHGVTGLAFVVARRAQLEADSDNCGSLYFDLRNYYRQQAATGYSPFTPAVHSAFALDAALDELAQEGGWKARQARYRRIAARIAATLDNAGVSRLLDANESAAAMTAYRLPAWSSYVELHARLKNDGFVIYAGQGKLADSVFRIATMGDIRDCDVTRLQTSLQSALGVAA